MIGIDMMAAELAWRGIYYRLIHNDLRYRNAAFDAKLSTAS